MGTAGAVAARRAEALLTGAIVFVAGTLSFRVLTHIKIGEWRGVETTFYSSLAYISLLQLERDELYRKCSEAAAALRHAE